MRSWRGLLAPLGLTGLLVALPGVASASPVAVDLGTAAGARLGRLVGEQEASHTYFALADVARVAGAATRRRPGGARVDLVTRHGTLELARDSRQVRIGGRAIQLGAPVRVRRGAWQVPGDLLVRALPALVGTGVRVAPGALPAARPAPPAVRAAPPAVARAVARPAVLPPARPPVTPAVALPPAPPPARPPAPAAPREADEGPRRKPGVPAAAAPRASARAPAVELRFRSYPTYTRVVLESGEPLEPRLVDTREGLTVLFPGLDPRGWRESRTLRDGLVGTLELGEARGAAALIVTFERAPASRRVHRLEEPHRLVLDFHRAPAPAAGPPGGPAPLRTIVIDPGHGGHDPGAAGAGGLAEKELTLDVARRVAALVEDDLGVRVVLTRARDQFVALRERTALANRERADLFVSIHANAARGSAATGAETYFLSTEATDGAARRAAEDENRVIALEPRGRNGSADALRSILWDLAQSDFQQESSRVAEALQVQLDRALRRPSRGVKQAPFYVLGGAAMPAVLVEIGFITNPQEAERLRDDGYRERIARALAAGLAAYKRSYDQRVGAVARQ
jgi:N-acetylmuramoyl-L-alanine amidase